MAPRSDEQNEEIRTERRRAILDAALSVYARGGWAGTHLAAVAAEAKLARGLVYYYFQDKTGLFQALFESVSADTAHVARHLLLDRVEEDPLVRLVRYARLVCSSTLDDPRLALFFARLPGDQSRLPKRARGKAGAPPVADEMASLVAALGEAMEKGLVRRGRPELAANGFWGALVFNMIAVAALAEAPGQPVPAGGEEREELIEEVLSYAFEGVGAPSARWRKTCRRLAAEPPPIDLEELKRSGSRREEE